MEIYLQEEFAIEKPFQITRETAKIFYKAQQIEKITIVTQNSYCPSLLKVEYIKGVVM